MTESGDELASLGSSAAVASHITKEKRVSVVGGGLVGLTTGIEALKRGHDVTIFEPKPHDPRLVTAPHLQPVSRASEAGIAQWMPFSVDGLADDEQTEQIGWMRNAFDWYINREVTTKYREAMRRRKGVALWHEDTPIPEYLKEIFGQMGATKELGVPQNPLGFTYGWDYTSFAFNTPGMLQALREEFSELGGSVIARKIHDKDELYTLPTDVVVNCTGLASRDLFPDPKLKAIKGHIIFKENPGVENVIAGDDLIILPRTDDVLALGCLFMNEGSFDTVDPTAEEAADIKHRMDQLTTIDLQVFEGLREKLSKARVLGSTTGLRPYREGGVKVAAEYEGGKLVIHNIGHGGIGWTVAPGTATAAVDLMDKVA